MSATMDQKKEVPDVSENPLEEGRVEEKDLDNGIVTSKYRGTDADKHEMLVMGKKQVLRVCIIQKCIFWS